MIHRLDTGFLVAAEVTEAAQRSLGQSDWKTDQPPSDEEVEQMVEEERTEK